MTCNQKVYIKPSVPCLLPHSQKMPAQSKQYENESDLEIAQSLKGDLWAILDFNKRENSLKRFCPACNKLYECLAEPKTRMEKEQKISGICSDACWDYMTLGTKLPSR